MLILLYTFSGSGGSSPLLNTEFIFTQRSGMFKISAAIPLHISCTEFETGGQWIVKTESVSSVTSRVWLPL